MFWHPWPGDPAAAIRAARDSDPIPVPDNSGMLPGYWPYCPSRRGYIRRKRIAGLDVQGPRLEAFKVTGDVNVPAGKFSVVADAEAVMLGPYDGHEGIPGAGFRPIGVRQMGTDLVAVCSNTLLAFAVSRLRLIAFHAAVNSVARSFLPRGGYAVC